MAINLVQKNRAILIGFGLSVGVIVAAYFLLYLPKSQQAHDLAVSLQPLHRQIEEYQAMTARVPNPDRAVQELQNRIRRLKEQAASREEVPRIIQQLAQHTGTLDIEVVSITPREDLKEPEGVLPEGVSKVYVEVSLRCPYDILGRYIETLADLPTLFTVEDLRVEKRAAETTSVLEVYLIVSTYVLA